MTAKCHIASVQHALAHICWQPIFAGGLALLVQTVFSAPEICSLPQSNLPAHVRPTDFFAA